MTSVLAVALVLGGLIFFHEFGHFIVARLLGMGVHTFSLGFGPKLWGFTRGKTEYKLSAIPLGGYVHLAGEQPGEKPDDKFEENQLFSSRPAWQRLLVVAAGPVFNFLLGWLIYWALFLGAGQVTVFEYRVQEVFDDGPAQAAGIEPGDVITRINGDNIYFRESLLTTVLFSKRQPVTLTVESQGSEREVVLSPDYLSDEDRNAEYLARPKIGVGYNPAERGLPLGWNLGLAAAGGKAMSMIGTTLRSVWLLFDGTISLKGVGGPIMIAQAVGKGAQTGIVEVLLMAAFISINLGILNLFPIPVLDGGHILFFSFEAVTGRKVNEAVRKAATYAGIVLLLGLMLLAFYNDIERLLLT